MNGPFVVSILSGVMANRHDLAVRIRALLDGHQSRGRAGAWLVASISCVAAALVMVLSPIRVVAQPSARPKFDVVSVRRCAPGGLPGPASGEGGGRGTGPQYSPGRVRMQCMTVGAVMKAAYLGLLGDGEGLLNYMPSLGDDDWLSKAPGWVNSDLYTVEGKTDDPAAKASNERGRRDGDRVLERMLQMALEDRFQLKLHQETAEVPMYNLTVASGGIRLKPMEPGGCSAPDSSQGTVAPRGVFITGEWSPAGRTPPCMIVLHVSGPDWAIDAAGQKPGNLVGMLSKVLNRHVFDKTGIPDLYTFHLRFAHDGSTPGNLPPAMIESMFPHSDIPPGPSIFTVLERLGLKLEPTKGLQGHFVIDHIERPSEN
ncbi:MAG TPA: TIGR03435 family protein [Vicinamibacterales bacterium]|nr:TIGR03435 family protein [Vicinamibacterales bacterium]